ncbi:MAG TPA: LPS export ABC transporter permease LptG [candidate division Zixibacteria bacterium]|nr:LPS export ABC transporter permease LptG [candidate division Zixibacteria bacterium]
MAANHRIRFLPLGSVLDRYIARGFIAIFFASLAVVTSLFVVVEFFDRTGTFIDAGVSLMTAIRYLLYKVPLSISRVIGFATLFSTLFCLGTLARSHEITAMRAGGLTVQRIALPLLLLSLVICGVTFLWNEALVPVFTHRAQTIYKTHIKNKLPQSLFGTRDIWIRSENSFINVDRFDTRRVSLEGITVFTLNRDFSLKNLIEIPAAEWDGRQWKTREGVRWSFLPDGKMSSEKILAAPQISETPDDLKLLARDAEEFTFFDLQKHIAEMKSKGIDATVYEVDLQVKLAIPFISPLMVLLATPFALKRRIGAGMALSFGTAMVIAFGYWVLSAFCFSLGHSGTLAPWAAAWIPNLIFAMIGLFFFTAEE